MSEEEYQEFKKKKNVVVLAGDGAVETVAKNMSQFSDRQVQKAKILNHKKIVMIDPPQECVEGYQFKKESNKKGKRNQ
eukprot:6291579-Ditylum_brightwellii.AAC.2